MATLGNLVTYLKMDNTNFNRGAKQAQTTLSRVEGGLNKFKKIALSAGAALGAAFTAGAVVNNIRKTADAIDNLAKTADKLSIDTKQLAGLRLASELTGAGTSTLDNGLQRMIRNISEANQAVGMGRSNSVVRAMNELGLSAEELNDLPVEQKMYRIADAMQAVTNDSDRLRLTIALFGKEGGKLVNTLAMGSSGLRETQAEAERLGIAVDRLSAAKVEEMNDAMTRLNASVQGLSVSFSTHLAPALTMIIDEMNTFIDGPLTGMTRMMDSVRLTLNKTMQSIRGGLGLNNAIDQSLRRDEQVLKKNLGLIGSQNNIGPIDFEARRQEKMRKARIEAQKQFGEFLGGAINSIASFFGQVAKMPERFEPMAFQDTNKFTPAFDSSAKKQGSAAAFSAILDAMGSDNPNKPEEKTAKNTNVIAAKITEIDRAIKDGALTKGLDALFQFVEVGN